MNTRGFLQACGGNSSYAFPCYFHFTKPPANAMTGRVSARTRPAKKKFREIG